MSAHLRVGGLRQSRLGGKALLHALQAPQSERAEGLPPARFSLPKADQPWSPCRRMTRAGTGVATWRLQMSDMSDSCDSCVSAALPSAQAATHRRRGKQAV